MEKLTFYYSAMEGGKSNNILPIAYNYEKNGQKVILLKSGKDTKGDDYLVSRVGGKRKVDIVLSEDESLLSEKYCDKVLECDYIIVDEVQFLTPIQVEELWRISELTNIHVICFGLKTNFQGKLFEGSKRLIELGGDLIELPNIPLCSCGEKARFNARVVDGKFTLEGNEIEIDGADENVEYKPLCGKCFLQKVMKKTLF